MFDAIQHILESGIQGAVMKTITRRFWFSYGHRVFQHESACANIHGHNATLFVTVTGPQDKQGRIIDFGELKKRVDPWLQEHWDHAFLWNANDPVGQYLYEDHASFANPVRLEIKSMRNFKCPFNPTAEEMCSFLMDVILPELLSGTELRVVNVTMYETDNCSASVEV